MKKYRVNVNGTTYEIAVEEIKDGEVSSIQNTASTSVTPVVNTTSETPKVPVAQSPVSSIGDKLNSPMPGTILDVKVANGDKVKKGQLLMILEAMKMENEIVSPKDGIISSVQVSKGLSVNSGALLCVIE